MTELFICGKGHALHAKDTSLWHFLLKLWSLGTSGGKYLYFCLQRTAAN